MGSKGSQRPGRTAKLNGVDQGRAAALAGNFQAVVFEPDLLSLVKGGPEGRRRFLDSALCQVYRPYLVALRRYTRLVAQKNALLKSYDDFAAADPACVQRMLADVEALAPAQHYGIIVGCHGKAWVPANQGALSYSARMSKELEDLWTPAPGALTTRSFGDTGRSIDITDFAAAVKAQNYRTDYLLFDACFMANIETLYDLRECTDYVIAAPCEIMGQGFPYDRAMPWFFTDGGKGRDLTKVCEAFWNFYMNDATTQSGCISLAVMSEMEGMKEVMRRINAAPKKSYAEELQSYEGMSSHIFYDLGHWVELACGDAKLKEDFKAQLDKAFPKAARLSTPGFYSAYNGRMNPVAYYSGVSFSEPSDKYVEENKQTSWYRDTH